MFFAMLGWLILMILSLGFMIGGSIAVVVSTAFSGGKPWPVLIPIGVGAFFVYLLCTHAPFHITFS